MKQPIWLKCYGDLGIVPSDAGDVFVWGYGILGKGPKLSESRYPERIPAILFGRTELKPDVMVTQVHCGLHHFAAITGEWKSLIDVMPIQQM